MRTHLLAVLSLTGCAIDTDITDVEQHVGQRVLMPVAGTGQLAIVLRPYHPLGIALFESDGTTPVAGEPITFTAPASGASALFDDGGVTETDAAGRASLSPYANERAGAFMVWAHADGAAPTPFVLANFADAPGDVVAVSGMAQRTWVGLPFAQPLVVEVRDLYGNPVSDAAVEFIGPSAGPSARMADHGKRTDAQGRVTQLVMANDQLGSYTIRAQVAGAGEDRFVLENTRRRASWEDGVKIIDATRALTH